MIRFTEELRERLSFENLRNGFTFDAHFDDRVGRWLVSRTGDPRGSGDYVDHRWGSIEPIEGGWLAYAGTVPPVEGQLCKTRDHALELVTDVPGPGAIGTE